MNAEALKKFLLFHRDFLFGGGPRAAYSALCGGPRVAYRAPSGADIPRTAHFTGDRVPRTAGETVLYRARPRLR